MTWYFGVMKILGGAPISICHFFHPSTSHPPYLRNRTSSNHNFWYIYVKWQYLQGFLFIFLKFCVFGLLGVKGKKLPKKWKTTIIYVTCHISQEQIGIWSWFLVHLCKMMTSLGVFFIVLKFSLFGLLAR